jgi:hypothetical protein
MTIIDKTVSYLNEHSKKYLTEALKFEPTEFGTDPKNPINGLFDVDTFSRYTYFMHEGQLFKAFVNISRNELEFGILKPNTNIENVTPRDFLIGEKSDININMISFWPKLLFIFKKMFEKYHYEYITFSTAFHTAKLYKDFMNNSKFLGLIKQIGFEYDKTETMGHEHFRYIFRNIHSTHNSREELISRYEQALTKLRSQLPDIFMKAYDQYRDEVMNSSDEDLRDYVETMEGQIMLKELKELKFFVETKATPYDVYPGFLTLTEATQEFLK